MNSSFHMIFREGSAVLLVCIGLQEANCGDPDINLSVADVTYLRVTTDSTFTWAAAHKECLGRGLVMAVFHDPTTYGDVASAFGESM